MTTTLCSSLVSLYQYLEIAQFINQSLKPNEILRREKLHCTEFYLVVINEKYRKSTKIRRVPLCNSIMNSVYIFIFQRTIVVEFRIHLINWTIIRRSEINFLVHRIKTLFNCSNMRPCVEYLKMNIMDRSSADLSSRFLYSIITHLILYRSLWFKTASCSDQFSDNRNHSAQPY